jgi:hypothetical protein
MSRRSFILVKKNCLALPKTMGRIPEFWNRLYCWTIEMIHVENFESCA